MWLPEQDPGPDNLMSLQEHLEAHKAWRAAEEERAARYREERAARNMERSAEEPAAHQARRREIDLLFAQRSMIASDGRVVAEAATEQGLAPDNGMVFGGRRLGLGWFLEIDLFPAQEYMQEMGQGAVSYIKLPRQINVTFLTESGELKKFENVKTPGAKRELIRSRDSESIKKRVARRAMSFHSHDIEDVKIDSHDDFYVYRSMLTNFVLENSIEL